MEGGGECEIKRANRNRTIAVSTACRREEREKNIGVLGLNPDEK